MPRVAVRRLVRRLYLEQLEGREVLSVTFVNSGQMLGQSPVDTLDVAIGDLDGDGDVDAYQADYRMDRVWLNDGTGHFTDSEQDIGNSPSFGVLLGDFDGDDDVDQSDFGSFQKCYSGPDIPADPACAD